jgi:flagellar hook-basal body complex protein FliE
MIPLIPLAAGTVLSDLQSLAAEATGSTSSSATVRGKASFTETLKQAIDQVNGQIIAANSAAMSYAAGDHAVPLSSVMISLEKANLAFQTAVTVRDRVTEAYNSIMNMQV